MRNKYGIFRIFKKPVLNPKTPYSEYTEYIQSKSILYFHKKLVPTQFLIEYGLTKNGLTIFYTGRV